MSSSIFTIFASDQASINTRAGADLRSLNQRRPLKNSGSEYSLNPSPRPYALDARFLPQQVTRVF